MATIIHTPPILEDTATIAYTRQRATLTLAGMTIAIHITDISAPDELVYVFADHASTGSAQVLGSATLLADESGDPIPNSAARYYPFGDWRTEPTADETSRWYTGHVHDNLSRNDLGLIYMNARFYLPYLNRFLSADTIIPDPTNPQSFNRYSYGYNNPVKFIDPTGHISCGALGTEACDESGNFIDQDPLPTVQYDLTDWLAREMVYNANGPEIRVFNEIQTWAHRQLGRLMNLSAASNAFMHGRAAELDAFNNLLGAWKQWDIKRRIEPISQGIILCGLDGCGWFDYSTPGNIHFGYIAAAVGTISRHLSQFAGGFLEILEGTAQWENWHTSFEDPRDWASVEFGYHLYETYGPDITLNEFQQALTIDVRNSLQPPPLGFSSPFSAHPQSNHYPPGYFDCFPPSCQER